MDDQSIKASADDSPRGRAVGFTMSMLQRRFALKNDLISVILFGSAARGEAGEGSDIDILIVAEKFGTGGRFDVFNAIESDLKATVEYREISMTPYPRRLIEVDLPIKKISEHSRREKSIHHGHISTLHIWWARRPLAACRAVICAALWVDSADPLCPEKFRSDAAALMKRFFDPMGTDAIFACLGPALEIFSRYSRVKKASGEQVTLKVYLEHVWAAVAKEALIMIFQGADATGFEEDARLTAMWLWTLSAGANGNGNKKIESEMKAPPAGTDEKRWVEGLMAKKKGLGF